MAESSARAQDGQQGAPHFLQLSSCSGEAASFPQAQTFFTVLYPRRNLEQVQGQARQVSENSKMRPDEEADGTAEAEGGLANCRT